MAGRRDGILLGGCGLNGINGAHRSANLRYQVKSRRTREGVASPAVLLVARFGFNELKLKRIQIVAGITDEPSQQVAEKMGGIREGILRKRLVVRDGAYDAMLFSMSPRRP